MLFECICHQITIVGGDANRLCYPPKGSKTVEQLLQYVNMSILDRKDGTNHGQILQGCFDRTTKDFNVRQFHSMSYLDLKYLQETIGGSQDCNVMFRDETDQIGDCSLLTFFEYGLSTPAENIS